MRGLGCAVVAALAFVSALRLPVAAADGQPPDFDRALQFSQSVIGRPVGEYVLRDRLGKEARLSDYLGKPLVVSFIYTSCSQVCPTTTRFLARSVREASAALGPGMFNILTIGFNPPFDSPDAMAAYARQNGISEPGWEFLSPDMKSVGPLTRDFGFTYYATPKGFDHITQLSIVDAQGQIYRQVYGDTFDLPLLVGPLKELLSGQARRAGGFDSLWLQVKLFCTVYDANTGGYRLNYSLFIEIFAGASVLIGIAWFYIRGRRRAVRQGF